MIDDLSFVGGATVNLTRLHVVVQRTRLVGESGAVELALLRIQLAWRSALLDRLREQHLRLAQALQRAHRGRRLAHRDGLLRPLLDALEQIDLAR